MQLVVEGVVTSIQVIEKGDKEVTEFYLAQQGERQQVQVRMDGNQFDRFELFEKAKFAGRLMAWKTRDAVGMMVINAEPVA